MARKFVVVKAFKDLQDKNYVYKTGKFYPREGVELAEDRAEELASGENAQNEPLIVEVLTEEAIEKVKADAVAENEAKAKAEKQKQKKETKK